MSKPIDIHLIQHRQFIKNTQAGCNCEHYLYRQYEGSKRILIQYGKSPSGARYTSNPYDFQYFLNGVLQQKRVGITTATDFDAWLVALGLLDEGVKTNEIA